MDQRPDDLAALRADLAVQRATIAVQQARLAAQEAAIARLSRRRLPRRALPIILAALLVALAPLATLAANPFTDLNPGSVHNPNIDALFTAGITTGCGPTAYCPTETVTREQMASFLARTAGLGGNQPVANAATAQTAANALALGGQPASFYQPADQPIANAQNAVNAQDAQNARMATSATTAQNALSLGGQPAAAYLPASGTMTMRYPGAAAYNPSGAGGGTLAPNAFGGATLPLGGGQSTTLIVPLPRPTAAFGRFLAVQDLRVCYEAELGVVITQTILFVSERGFDDDVALIDDPTDRGATEHACYNVAITTPQAVAGMNFLALRVANNSGGPTRLLLIDSVALTLVPLAAGAAEVPGEGGGQPRP